MINIDVLRIIIAKGAGDGTLKKISKCIANDMSYSLNDICNNIHTNMFRNTLYNICVSQIYYILHE